MIRRLPVLALFLAGAASAGEIPSRPEALRLESERFPVPRAADHRFELSSGIPVYLVRDATVPLVDVTLALRVGDYLDPPGRTGLASLTGALLRRGGAGELEADAFDVAADHLAAELDSVTGLLRSGVTLNCASHVLEESLALWAAMLLTPRFDPSRLALVEANLMESLTARNDDPLAVLEREWAFLLYGPGHFQARQVTPSNLERIRREDLVAFHRRYWRPDTAVIAVAGDVTRERIQPLLERHLGDWAPADEPLPPPDADLQTAPPGLYHAEHATPQAKLLLGHPTSRRRSWRDADALALEVMAEILGGGGTVSRLRSRLRGEEALVYRASASVTQGLHHEGEVQVFLETAGGNAARALDLARAELERLRREEPPEAELGLAKKTLIDSFPLLFDTAQETAGRFAEDEYLGRPHSYWERYRPGIAAVTAADVRRVARRHIRPDRLRILAVGPWAELEGLTEVAGEVDHLPVRHPLTLEPLRPLKDSGTSHGSHR